MPKAPPFHEYRPTLRRYRRLKLGRGKPDQEVSVGASDARKAVSSRNASGYARAGDRTEVTSI